LWQDNFLTAAIPFVFAPYITALPGVAVPFHDTFVPVNLPTAYNVQGQPIFATGRSQDVPANTEIDLPRFQNDLTALTPGNQVQLLTITGIAKNFSNGYIGSWTAGVDHDFRDVKVNVSYVATTGIHLARVYSPNSYNGADPAHAPFTEFNSAGQAIGGYGTEVLMTSGSHSSYHSLQSSVTKNSARLGLGLQASYTYSKSIDDTSSVLGGPRRRGGNDLADATAESMGSVGGKRAVDLRCDSCVFGKRDPVAAAGPHCVSATAGENADQRLAVSEHHDVDHGIALQRVFGDTADRRGRGRYGSPGSGCHATFFDEPSGA